jgi:hypothetical protein
MDVGGLNVVKTTRTLLDDSERQDFLPEWSDGMGRRSCVREQRGAGLGSGM